MDVETRLGLVKREPTEEVITEQDMRSLLETNDHPGHYIGYEISGKLHIGSLVVSGFKVNDLAKAGFNTQVWLADWHTFINNKLEGNWKKIHAAARYYKEAFEFFCPKTKAVLASDVYHNNDEFWRDVLTFSKHMTLARATRTLTILGRSERDNLHLAQFFYSPMQGVDVKLLEANVPHAGMDQRKIHVLAREVFPKMGWFKPAPVHHHLLPGLTAPAKAEGATKEDVAVASKMSKSKPDTCIFIHDSPEEIRRKLAGAWCPERIVEGNPVIEIARYILFHENETLAVERRKEHGGNIEFNSPEELEKTFAEGKLHPSDLKAAVAGALAEVLRPVREHFEKPANAKLLDVYKETKITR
ncbi:tyrosine--tRNA ligase [archaeon]|nr:tyrosine--tRNA ligase [archaeon]